MNSQLKRVYKYFPIWLQNMMISLYGYKIYRQRYGEVYHKTIAYLLNKDYSNFQSELDNQFFQLKEFLNFAVNNSVFYKKAFENININEFNSIEDLNKLPIIDKEILRRNIDEIYTVEEKDAISSFTGGTTGKALKVLFTKEDFQIRMAYLDAFKSRLGIDPFKMKKATFSGRSLVYKGKTKTFWRYNFIYRQRLYSTFHLSQSNIPFYLSDLNKYKPEILNGFVSALYELAEYIKRKDVKLDFTPKAIFTTSETLLPIHRMLLEEVFNCKVYDQYASAEGAPFITECLKGNLHYNIDTGVIETDDNDRMIVTSFTTRGTPLIRYNIGDIIKFKQGSCNCGSSHPLVESIDGRKVDFLYTKFNSKISLSHLADVIKGNPNSIIKMQFVQNEIDQIDVLMVIDKNIYCEDHADKILEELKYRFGVDTKLNLIKVDDIPKEQSGKYLLIKNNIVEELI